MDNDPSARLRSIDWDQLLLVYLHDPIDKALDIRGHESRAARYASRALDREVTRKEIKDTASLADQLASRAERLPMPTAGPDGERAVGPEDGRIEVRHPVSAQPDALDGLAMDEVGVLEAIGSIVDDLPDPRSRFLALWRLLPERLAERLGQGLARLPADTRVPDHTLMQHADITSGLWVSREGAGGALLSVSLGPVQSFIAAARSVRDLWSGSAVLSWLTFQGLRPVLETLGPTALVYPALRGNPLMDLWLRNDAGLDDVVPLPPEGSRRSPSLPNRFVALVPWGSKGAEAQEMANTCEEAVRAAWRRLADDVRGCLDRSLSDLDRGWARRWQAQVDSFFEVRTATLPVRDMKDETVASMIGGAKAAFNSVWPEAAKVRGLADAIPENQRPSYAQRAAGLWQAQLEASARLMEAQRSIRHVPEIPLAASGEPSPPKCSLLGSYEQMGPAGLDDSRRFWEGAADKVKVLGVRLRSRERFSAIALCKRFAAPATLAREFGLDSSGLRFPDTATVAAADWLSGAGIDPDTVRREHGDWNGRWLHSKSREAIEDDGQPPPAAVRKKIEEARKDGDDAHPPVYYAVLAMDADRMGRWLKGDYAPKVCEVLHPKMAAYYKGLGGAGNTGLEAKRPVGPALHASISEALNNFASHVAPGIVEECRGTMIYSGGDDVLALLPARRAVECAVELRRAFRGEDGSAPGWKDENGRQLLTMGNRATLSAGIAFVHFMEDLRLALEEARQAEKSAKEDGGRDWLKLHFMRRSGEHSKAGLSWEHAPWFRELVRIFAGGATDRWAYRLRQELPILQADTLPDAAVGAEIRRLVGRTEKGGDTAECKALSDDKAEQWWKDYSRVGSERGQDRADLLEAFTLLCQGAAFVARGHDG